MVARIAAGLAPATQYPDPEFNWMVLNFRGEPIRQRGTLGDHADCRGHLIPMTIWLDVRARQCIEEHSHRSRFLETGGALFGWASGDDTVIMLAFGPGPRAEHRRRSFMPHRDDIGDQMQSVFHASEGRCRYVGSWHSHPLGRAIPSQVDTRTAAGIAAQADVLLPTPVLLINATFPVLRSRVGRIQAFIWGELEVSTAEGGVADRHARHRLGATPIDTVGRKHRSPIHWVKPGASKASARCGCHVPVTMRRVLERVWVECHSHRLCASSEFARASQVTLFRRWPTTFRRSTSREQCDSAVARLPACSIT